MASLYVTEYAGNAVPGPNGAQVAPGIPLATQKITIGGTSTASSAFNAQTKLVRLHADAICSFLFGAASPTAAATDSRLAADQTEYFSVQGGGFVAAITNT